MNKTDKQIDRLIEKGYTENQIVNTLMGKVKVKEEVDKPGYVVEANADTKELIFRDRKSGEEHVITSEEDLDDFMNDLDEYAAEHLDDRFEYAFSFEEAPSVEAAEETVDANPDDRELENFGYLINGYRSWIQGDEDRDDEGEGIDWEDEYEEEETPFGELPWE